MTTQSPKTPELATCSDCGARLPETERPGEGGVCASKHSPAIGDAVLLCDTCEAKRGTGTETSRALLSESGEYLGIASDEQIAASDAAGAEGLITVVEDTGEVVPASLVSLHRDQRAETLITVYVE